MYLIQKNVKKIAQTLTYLKTNLSNLIYSLKIVVISTNVLIKYEYIWKLKMFLKIKKFNFGFVFSGIK